MDDFTDASRFEEESYTMLVDSSRRNALAFPLASEYTVDFSGTPFKNVVGVELLAATVPRSGYVVDSGKNVLAYALGAPPYAAANIVSVTLDPGDYNLAQLCDHASARVSAGAGAGAAALTASPFTTPAEISNKIAFQSPTPFALFLDRGTLGGKLGFGRAVNADDVAAGFYAGTPAWRARPFVDANVYVAVATVSSATSQAFTGPEPFSDTLALGAGVGNALTQLFTVQTGGVASALTFAVAALPAPTTFSVRVLDAAGATVAAGNVAAAAADASVVVPLTATGGGMGVVTAGNTATIELSASLAGCTVYVNPPNVPVDSANELALGGATASTTLALCGTLDVLSTGYRVVSPGVVDLTGDRFLVVRCPEVETYLVRGERLASEATHPGIGLLTLGTYGYSEARLDFFHAKPRTLTAPIGRLSRMSFRLESQDGALYPSRGCDHTLLVNVRFLVPKKRKSEEEDESLLSPGYDPDVWLYRAKTEARDAARGGGGATRAVTRY